jgi:hypothetical protein
LTKTKKEIINYIKYNFKGVYMKILYRENRDRAVMFDTNSNIISMGKENSGKYFLCFMTKFYYGRTGAQNEIENIFNDIVAAEKRGDKVYEIK